MTASLTAVLQLIYELRKNCCGRDGWTDGWKSKVLQEVLADLKMCSAIPISWQFFRIRHLLIVCSQRACVLGLRGRGNNSLLCQCSSLCEILPRGPITNNSLNCYLLNQTNLGCIYNLFTRIVHLPRIGSLEEFFNTLLWLE